jgi:O-antigen ligase
MPSLAVFLAITLPWLNPFSSGPSPAVLPWLFTLGCFAVFLLLAARVRLAEVAASAWLAAALLSAVMGLLQYFGATAMFGSWINSTGVGEAYANLRQRNQFATLTNIGLAALLWWVAQGAAVPVSAQGAARRPLGWHSAAVAAAVLLAAGNAASSSRTGLVQLVLLVVLTLIWDGVRRALVWRVLLAAALAYGLALLLLPLWSGLDPLSSGMLGRLQEGDPRCASRLTLWGNVLHLIAQKPWLGWGWGWGELDYAHFITLYPGERFCGILDNAHNLPLHLAVELGVPLALLICGGGLWLVWRARPWRETDATRQLAWSVLAVILLHSLLEYPLWYGPFQVAFGVSVWLLGSRSGRCGAVFGSFRPLAPVVLALVAIVLIAVSGYAMWDYHRISQIYLAPALRMEAYRDNTLAKIGDSCLFDPLVHFAELTTTPLTAANAAHVHDLAREMLHFSPESRVAEKLIESATLLGRQDEAVFYLARYRAAFPAQHAQWAKTLTR